MVRRCSPPLLIAACLLLALGQAVHAQPSDVDRALATELFDRGRALMAEKRYDEACEKLGESQRLDPGGGTLLNLALCHEAQGKTATAWTEFAEALAIGERDRHEERIALAEERIGALRPRLSRLSVIVPSAAAFDGLVVERDGTPLARAAWGVPTPVDPGRHRVDARAPGRAPWSVDLDVGSAADEREVVVPVLDAVTAPPERRPAGKARPPLAKPRPEKPAETGGNAGRTAGWITGGLGLVLVGVGAYAGIVTLDKDAESDDACRPECTDRGLALNEEAKTAADVSTVTLASGAVALGVSVWLLLASDDAPESAAKTARRRDFLVLAW